VTEPVWIRDDVVVALHGRQLAEHGGGGGLRDAGGGGGGRDVGLLDSAVNAPKQLHHDEKADTVRLAAAYGFSLTNNHPFVDGNKRTAYVCMRLFLKLNGLDIKAGSADKIRIMLDLAAGRIDRDALTKWLRKHVVSLVPDAPSP
jgi:death on curing protein